MLNCKVCEKVENTNSEGWHSRGGFVEKAEVEVTLEGGGIFFTQPLLILNLSLQDCCSEKTPPNLWFREPLSTASPSDGSLKWFLVGQAVRDFPLSFRRPISDRPSLRRPSHPKGKAGCTPCHMPDSATDSEWRGFWL